MCNKVKLEKSTNNGSYFRDVLLVWWGSNTVHIQFTHRKKINLKAWMLPESLLKNNWLCYLNRVFQTNSWMHFSVHCCLFVYSGQSYASLCCDVHWGCFDKWSQFALPHFCPFMHLLPRSSTSSDTLHLTSTGRRQLKLCKTIEESALTRKHVWNIDISELMWNMWRHHLNEASLKKVPN